MKTLKIIFLYSLTVLFLIGCKSKTEEKEVIKIGCISILSGEVATYGKETKQGLDLAIEEANQSGMLKGKKIEVIYEDDKIDAKTGTQAINKLINIDKVPIIIGAFSSRVTLAIAPIAEEKKVVLLSASATADEIKDAGDYIFRIVPPNRVQGTSAAKFIKNVLNKNNTAVYYVNDEYGVSLASEFKKAFEGLSGNIVFYDAFFPGQKDFRTPLNKIKGTHPDVIYFPGQASETGLILKQAKELGINVKFVGGDGSYSPDLNKIAGNAAEGTYYTLMAMGYGVSDTLIQTFTQRFIKTYGAEPTVYAGYAYEAGKIVAKVLAETSYQSDSIKNQLYQLKKFKGITGYTTFDKLGEVDKEFYIYIIKDGKFIKF
jgi:branched-chain amino acid transport system substrate-binding protein